MEFDSVNIVQGSHDGGRKTETVLGGDEKHKSSKDTCEGKKVDPGKHGNIGQGVDSGDVNMEASISADDVFRAGGFGARDDISSFLPVASDSTDFEASLRDARDYEEPQKEICRPGLGWKDT